MPDQSPKPKPGERDEPLVIPLDAEEAVKGFVRVEPDDKPVAQRRPVKGRGNHSD